MSLRDELEKTPAGVKSKADIWFDSLNPELQTEFADIIADRTVEHYAVARLATKYGCPLALNSFSEWRKKQWASETN